MKKFLLGLVIMLTLGILTSETKAYSWEEFGGDVIDEMFGGGKGGVPEGEFALPDPGLFNQVGENTELRAYILQVVNFWLAFLGVVAVAFIIYAGFLYVTAGGDDGPHEKAKKIIIYASIGILVVLVSFALVNTVIKSGGGHAVGPSSSAEEDGFFDGENVKIEEGIMVVKNNSDADFDYPSDTGNFVTVSLADAQTEPGLNFIISSHETMNGLWVFSDETQQETGDGETLENDSVYKQFFEAGAYEVRFLGETETGGVIATKKIIVGGVLANFRASDNDLIINETVSLDGSRSRVAVGQITKYEWTCTKVGGETTGCFEEETTGKIVNVSFSETGEYEVFLTVIPNVGPPTDSEPQIFEVLSDTPEARFEVLPSDDILHPGKRIFDASGSQNVFGENTGLSYEWLFWDPSTNEIMDAPSSGRLVNYEFPYVAVSQNHYVVGLIVRQSHEGRTLESNIENLENPAGGYGYNKAQVYIEHTLGADFTIPQRILVSEDVILRAQSPDAEQFSWAAVFTPYVEGGGVGVPVFRQNPSNAPDQTVYFSEPGMYDITLTVTKNIGQDNEESYLTSSKRAYVQEEGQFVAVPLVTVGTGDDAIGYSSPASVTITRLIKDITFSSGNSLPESPDAPMTPSWSVDGHVIGDDDDMTGFNFSEVKTYAVSLKVFRPGNPDIGNTASFSVVVENVAPNEEEIEMKFNNEVDPPQPTDLNPAGSYNVSVEASDPDTGDDLDHYVFDLLDADDGDVLLDRINSETKEVSFNLNQFPGDVRIFRFAVTVHDIDGGETYYLYEKPLITEIEVDNEIPVVDDILILSNGGSEVGTVDTDFRFQIDAHDDDRDNLTYAWEILTNPPIGEQAPAPDRIGQGTTSTFSHRFEATGQYLVKATVNDGIFDSAEVEQAIAIIAEPLVVNFNVPQDPIEVQENYTFIANSPRAETFAWSFSENSVVSTPTNIPRVVAYFTTVGPHDVTLVVNQGMENEEEVTKKVFVYEIGEVIASIQVSSEENIINTRLVVLNQQQAPEVVITSISRDEDGDNPQGQGGGDGQYGNSETWYVNNTRVRDISTYDFSAIGNYNVRLDVESLLHPQEANDRVEVVIRVINAIPEIESVNIEEDPNDPTKARVTVVADDADGEIVNYQYQIIIDGVDHGQPIPSNLAIYTSPLDALIVAKYGEVVADRDYVFSFRVTAKDNDNAVSEPMTSNLYEYTGQ